MNKGKQKEHIWKKEHKKANKKEPRTSDKEEGINVEYRSENRGQRKSNQKIELEKGTINSERGIY